MTYIKRLVMKGFKSFARETRIDLDRNMNVIVGPNGSGKSNITDALCFVLGRLSIKSIRAAKASHLIFSGNKHYKGSNLAYVEIIFDNSDKTFALDDKEIIIRRIVKKNGQSTYKINDQVKTRQEIIELLSQAGIDPHGFNIILQGEIERFVKMPADERRKVIEEVAGISIYEMRKEKSYKELEKTDERLRQIIMILRERTKFLQNLERDREQALKFKKLQESEKRCRASIIHRNLQEKEKEEKNILQEMTHREKEIFNKEKKLNEINNEIGKLRIEADDISNKIQKETGLEQESLNAEISELRVDIAGMSARKENLVNQLEELDRRRLTVINEIKDIEKEIKGMREEKGKYKKSELEKKKARLEELEDSKRNFFKLKAELSSLIFRIEDKKRQINIMSVESNHLLKQIEQTEKELEIKDDLNKCKEKIIQLQNSIESDKEKIVKLEEKLLEKEKNIAAYAHSIKEAEIIKSQVSQLDICPLCRTNITKEHIDEVISKSNEKISKSGHLIEESEKQAKEIGQSLKNMRERISQNNSELNLRKITIVKLQAIDEKKQQLKRADLQIDENKKELTAIDAKRKALENKISMIKIDEEQHERLQLEINELQRIDDKDVGREIASKQMDLEKARLIIKQIERDKKEKLEDLEDINSTLEEKENILEEKEEQAEKLKNKYDKIFEHRNKLQDRIKELEQDAWQQRNHKSNFETAANELKIKKAQVLAKKESFIDELKEYKGIEFLSGTVNELKDRLDKIQYTLKGIGNVNMRALEVYEGVKAEYDKIQEKVEQLEKEKEEILKIIAQIDRKKKKTFLHTLESINNLFSDNFSRLSAKGRVTIEPQDKNDIFSQGLSIIVRVGGGKYFDVTSLSGGEQTLVALSLIFAIQEYKPYHFYIFDEIDAALDRRNSEKLAYLLKKHMKHGQYLIITHNDSIISESSETLYGVSMQEGISKVLSLKL